MPGWTWALLTCAYSRLSVTVLASLTSEDIKTNKEEKKKYTFPNGSICAASRIYALKIKKKKEKKTGETKSREQKKKKKTRNPLSPTCGLWRPHLSPALPPYAATHIQMCFIIMFCAKARMIHHEGDLRGRRWRRGGTPDIHPSERPPFYPPCTLSLLLMYQSEKLHTAEAPARRHLAAGETLRAKLESEPSLVLRDNVTEIRLLLQLHLMKSFNQIECLRKDDNIQSNSLLL